MLDILNDTQSVVDQRHEPRSFMAASDGIATSSRTVCIPNHAERSPSTSARLDLAQEVAKHLPGVQLDDTWLVYPAVKLAYSTTSGPGRWRIAVVLPSLNPPGYFRSTKSVIDFFEQLQQEQLPLPGVVGHKAATGEAAAAITAVLDSLGQAFVRSQWVSGNSASPSSDKRNNQQTFLKPKSSGKAVPDSTAQHLQEQQSGVNSTQPAAAPAALAAAQVLISIQKGGTPAPAAAVPRKRGRPPKHSTQQPQTQHGQQEVPGAAAAPRKRGRPPKHSKLQEPGEASAASVAAPAATNPAAIGAATNRSPSSTAQHEAGAPAPPAAAAAVPAPRKRGRPPKHPKQQVMQPDPDRHEQSDASVAAAAAAAAGPAAASPFRKRNRDTAGDLHQQQHKQDEEALLPSAEDSTDSGAVAAVSSPATAAAAEATVEPSPEPVERPAAAKARSSSPQSPPAAAATAKRTKTSHGGQQPPSAVTIAAAVQTSEQRTNEQQQQQQAAQHQTAGSKGQQEQRASTSSAAAAAGASQQQEQHAVQRRALQQRHAANPCSSTWKVPVMPRNRPNDEVALGVLAQQVIDAFPGWKLDEFWVMSPGNSSPAKPRIDPCIMHPSILHGYIRSNRAALNYLKKLQAAVARIGKDVQVPGLVPTDSSKKQQQQQIQKSQAAAVSAAIVKAAHDIGRGFVGFRGYKSSNSKAPRSELATEAAAGGRGGDVAESSAAAAARAPAPPAAARASAAEPKWGARLGDGRVPCPLALAVLQNRITKALPGIVLDGDWIAYPGGDFSGCKLDVCVMHPSTPLGYFRSMKAVITYLAALEQAAEKLPKNTVIPGLLPAAAAAGQQQNSKKQSAAAGAAGSSAAAAAAGAKQPLDRRVADAILTAIEATGRTFVPRSRTAGNIINRIPEGSAANSRGFSKAELKHGADRVLKSQTEQQQQQKGKKTAAAAGSSKAKGPGSSSSNKVANLNKLSSLAAAAASKKAGSSSGSKGKALKPKPIIAKPKASKTAAAALVAKAKSKALAAAKSKTLAAAAAAKPKATPLVVKPKGPLVIVDKPHAQPKYSWKHPPVDREWDAPPKGAVLVLGMHFASAAAVDECHAGMAQHRDRARLLQLQQGLGYTPYSFDRDNKEADAEGGLHIQGNFNSLRGARDVTNRFPGVKFGGIFLDYFRMPTGYALEIYKQQLFTQFVPELVRLGAAAKGVPVVVPNNEVLLSKLAKEGAFQGYGDFVAMPGECYPLYQASELASAKGQLQGAYNNLSEVRSLCEGSEFVVMHCNMTAPLNGN